MIPSTCPRHLHPATTQCFRRVQAWLEREAAAAPVPLVIGIGGPGGCGKSTLARWLRHHLDGARILALDDFRLPRARRPAHGRYGSHPDGNDLPRLRKILRDFRAGRPIRQPVFDPVAGAATTEIRVPSARILLADGEIAAHRDVRAAFDRLILVEAHWRTQLDTRLARDVRERHCPLEKAIDLFLQSNLRDYPRFAAGAADDAHILLYRNRSHIFTPRIIKPHPPHIFQNERESATAR